MSDALTRSVWYFGTGFFTYMYVRLIVHVMYGNDYLIIK